MPFFTAAKQRHPYNKSPQKCIPADCGLVLVSNQSLSLPNYAACRRGLIQLAESQPKVGQLLLDFIKTGNPEVFAAKQFRFGFNDQVMERLDVQLG